MKKLLILILPVLAFWSCQDVIELDLPEGDVLLVIDGQITDQPGETFVYLSETVPYFDEEGNPPVPGATISLFEDDALVSTFIEPEPGFYLSSYVGTTEKSYRIEVELADGRRYSSESELLPRVPTIDSVYYRFETDLQFLDDGYYVYFATQELPGQPEFYRWKFYFNSVYQNTPFDIQLANDDFVDGNYISEFAVSFDPFLIGDTVVVEQYSTSRAYFDYWNLIATQTAQVGGPFDPPPAPVIGNMTSLSNSDEVVLGYFSAHGLATGQTIVQE